MQLDGNVILHIDTSDRAKSVIGIGDAGGVRKLEVETPMGSGTAVLTAIDQLLGKHKLTVGNITEVNVVTGPGSYTGLRVGVAIANILGELLGVPVNGLPVGQTVTPVYEGDRW